MAKPKRSTDFNQRALEVVLEATGEKPKQEPDSDPKAVERGRKGGLVGGKARAKKLSAEERREIAKKAAAARWRR